MDIKISSSENGRENHFLGRLTVGSFFLSIQFKRKKGDKRKKKEKEKKREKKKNLRYELSQG